MAYYTTRNDARPVIMGMIAIAVLMVVGLPAIVSYNTFHERIVMVCEKERAATSGGDAEYRVYTSDGTFVMEDILLAGTRFDTADAYGKLKTGKSYEVTYKGWRVPFFSMFPNIVGAKQLPEGSRVSGQC